MNEGSFSDPFEHMSIGIEVIKLDDHVKIKVDNFPQPVGDGLTRSTTIGLEKDEVVISVDTNPNIGDANSKEDNTPEILTRDITVCYNRRGFLKHISIPQVFGVSTDEFNELLQENMTFEERLNTQRSLDVLTESINNQSTVIPSTGSSGFSEKASPNFLSKTVEQVREPQFRFSFKPSTSEKGIKPPSDKLLVVKSSGLPPSKLEDGLYTYEMRFTEVCDPVSLKNAGTISVSHLFKRPEERASPRQITLGYSVKGNEAAPFLQIYFTEIINLIDGGYEITKSYMIPFQIAVKKVKKFVESGNSNAFKGSKGSENLSEPEILNKSLPISVQISKQKV